MSLPHDLSLIIQRSHSLGSILDDTAELIAKHLDIDVCSIYLVNPIDRELYLAATYGLEKSAVGKVRMPVGQGLTGKVVDELRAVTVEDASSHPGYLYFPETREEQFKSFLGVPMVINNRPVGAIVIQTVEPRIHKETEVQTLFTISAQLVGVVENARLIAALDRGAEGEQYLTEEHAWLFPEPGSERRRQNDVRLEGSAASPGIAIAEVVVRGSLELSDEDRLRTSLGPDSEKSRVRDALERTRTDIVKIQKQAETEADEEHALIFSSHLLLLNDPVLIERVDGLIDAGANAPAAVDQALTEFSDRLRAVSDPYLRDRLEDILDLRSRLLANLLRGGDFAVGVENRVVVSRGTPPSLVVELKAKGARALVTQYGGSTSHGALLARSMGIPAVTGVDNIEAIARAGDPVIVDGNRGLVVVRPSPQTLESYERKIQREDELRSANLQFCHLPARTRDGRRIRLLANIGVASDLNTAKENGADGIGLYRTEFPFIIREHFPNAR